MKPAKRQTKTYFFLADFVKDYNMLASIRRVFRYGKFDFKITMRQHPNGRIFKTFTATKESIIAVANYYNSFPIYSQELKEAINHIKNEVIDNPLNYQQIQL